jgi:hypothetical protein
VIYQLYALAAISTVFSVPNTLLVRRYSFYSFEKIKTKDLEFVFDLQVWKEIICLYVFI